VKHRLWATIVPGLLIVAMLGIAYDVTRPTSGIDVRVLAGHRPAAAQVRVTKAGRRETLAGRRLAAGERVRLRLQSGRYVVRPARRRGWRARPEEVFVPSTKVVAVTVRYRRGR
jgi:hypothetical protein